MAERPSRTLLEAWEKVENLVGRVACSPESTVDRVRLLADADLRVDAVRAVIGRAPVGSLVALEVHRALEEPDEVIRGVAPDPDRSTAAAYAEVLESAAQLLHSRRHRLGWGSVCGSCRELAAEVLAVGRR